MMGTLWRAVGVLTGVICIASSPLASQSSAERTALAAFRDSLQAMTDEGELVARRQVLRAAVRAEMDDITLMRLGAVWHRLAQVTESGAAFSAARSAFEEVTARQPDWPMAWDGVAEAVLGEHQSASGLAAGIVDIFGGQPNRRVAEHYLRGAQADTLWSTGLVALLDAAVRSNDGTLRDVALEAARLAAPLAVSHHHTLRIHRARLERDDGLLDSALTQLEALVDAEPEAADAHLELARIRFILGRRDGLQSWYRGLGLADSTVYAAYRRDLMLVFADTVLARIDAASPDERPELARREWQRQDPDGLPVIADRLRDHYRRFDFARRYYRLRRDPPPDDPLDWAGNFDARGRIYVRHGRPAIRTSLGRHGGPEVEATLRIVGAPPNETWRYGPPDETALLYHFVVRERGGDFTLAESALDILGLTAQYRMFRTEDVPEGMSLDSLPPPIQTYGAELVSMIAQELLMSRAPAHPLYAELVRQGKGGAEALQLAERTIGRNSNALPSQWSLQYELPLDADVAVLAVGQEGRQSVLQVGFSIAGSALLPIRTPRGIGYRVRMRAAVVNAAGEVVASVDTTRGFLTGTTLRPQDRLLGRLPIPVPPGTHRVRVALEADGLGLVAPRMMVDVPAPATQTLALSDLALGTRTIRLPWQTATGDTAWINPARRFTPDDPLELYFEVLGLASGTSYRVDIAVIRVSGREEISAAAERVLAEGGEPDLTLGFDQRHPGGIAGIAREVSLARLRPGEYVLEVTVGTVDGTTVVRRQPFVIGR